MEDHAETTAKLTTHGRNDACGRKVYQSLQAGPKVAEGVHRPEKRMLQQRHSYFTPARYYSEYPYLDDHERVLDVWSKES